MEGLYEVWSGDRSAGKVQVLHQGLYCRIICRCHVPQDQVYRLFLVQEGKRESIGVVVPEGDGCVLDKKIPAKRLGEGNIRFAVSAGAKPAQGKFIPICPEEPFLYIDRLKTAFLESEHGKIGIRTEERPGAV